MSVRMERVIRVWTQYGERFEVDEDGDGLGMLRLRFFTEKNKPSPDEVGITMTPEQAHTVAEALHELANDLEKAS